MTEQEKRIEETTRDFCENKTCLIGKEKNETRCYRNCKAKIYAIRAVNKGYRKADEVRKETAKEVITKIKNDIYFHYINSNVYQIDAYEEIRMMDKLLKEFGVAE